MFLRKQAKVARKRQVCRDFIPFKGGSEGRSSRKNGVVTRRGRLLEVRKVRGIK